MPAGTPNDGFPLNWHPVAGEEYVPGFKAGAVPSMGPPTADKYFATAIPLPMQLESDLLGVGYAGALDAYRVMPPVASGSPFLNSAIKSFG